MNRAPTVMVGARSLRWSTRRADGEYRDDREVLSTPCIPRMAREASRI